MAPSNYRRVLGINPAERTGWAIVDAEGRTPTKLVLSGTIKPEAVEVIALARHVADPQVRPDLVLMEDQYMGRNAKMLKKLAEMRTRFQQEFEVVGIPIRLIAAHEWQMGLLQGRIHARSPRSDRKLAAKRFGQALFGERAAHNQDEWDAACIATWAVKSGLV